MQHYRLIEWSADGARASERFPAPDDAQALARALEVSDAERLELWRGARLVHTRQRNETSRAA